MRLWLSDDAAAHGVGTAADHDPALDQLLDLHPALVAALVGERALERFRRHVAGREEHQLGYLGQEDVEQRLDMVARFVHRLRVGLAHIDRRAPADAVGGGLVAVTRLRQLAIEVEVARDRFRPGCSSAGRRICGRDARPTRWSRRCPWTGTRSADAASGTAAATRSRIRNGSACPRRRTGRARSTPAPPGRAPPGGARANRPDWCRTRNIPSRRRARSR